MPRLTALPGALPAGLLAGPVARRLRRWPVESQLGSRRNAMTASTALAARRAEREDVETFFLAVDPAPSPGAGVARA